jgi:hypothetical protein
MMMMISIELVIIRKKTKAQAFVESRYSNVILYNEFSYLHSSSEVKEQI